MYKDNIGVRIEPVVRHLTIDPMVNGSNLSQAKLSLRVRRATLDVRIGQWQGACLMVIW